MSEEIERKKLGVSKIKEAYPSLDEKIIELVSDLYIPLDDDFKIRYFLQLTNDEEKQEFLEDQYKLFLNFVNIMFKKQISRLLNRDVSIDMDTLISSGQLNNQTFILANTVNQFQILTKLLKKHTYSLYTHYTQIPEHLEKNVCNLCGAPLIYRDGMSDNNLQGSIVSADNNQHLFHFTCITNWVRDFSNCNICNMPIDKELFTNMSEMDKKFATQGSNFLDGYVGGKKTKIVKKNKSKKLVNKRKNNSRK
jgi:hypothetical protein